MKHALHTTGLIALPGTAVRASAGLGAISEPGLMRLAAH